MTWGPPVKVKFELATPNSVHGCTFARPTWRRIKKGDRVHSARAVHVQMFFTCSAFAATTGQKVGTADALMHATCRSHICYHNLFVFVATVLVRCRLRAPGPDKFI